MRILVTGAGGFIGSELVPYLSSRHNVFGVGRTSVKSDISLDLTKKQEVLSFFNQNFKEFAFDAIIHLAAKLPSIAEVEDTSILFDNLRISETMVEVAKLIKPGFFINFSSIAVYPTLTGKFKETSCIRPSDNTECYYALAKFSSENILNFGLRNENIKVCHLRVAQVYGKNMDNTRLIPTMLQELKMNNTITVFGNGKRTSSFLTIEELNQTMSALLKIKPAGIYNVGFRNVSYLKLAQKLIKKYGNKNSRIVLNSEGKKSRFFLDTQKIKKLLKEKKLDVHTENFL